MLQIEYTKPLATGTIMNLSLVEIVEALFEEVFPSEDGIYSLLVLNL